jgi:hypothetical protein
MATAESIRSAEQYCSAHQNFELPADVRNWAGQVMNGTQIQNLTQTYRGMWVNPKLGQT